MKAVVTGATGFLGGHVTKLLSERGDDVRVTYRNPDRLKHLRGVKVRRAKADVWGQHLPRSVLLPLVKRIWPVS
jgi:uncharacterized protein YbjT (DUF2867 family)